MPKVTVTQLNEYIARKLKDDYKLQGLKVEGEISGLKKSGAHYYLTLKDANSQINCAIWGFNAKTIDLSLVENGKKVVVTGDISPYAKGGSYSFSIRQVETIGIGALMAEYLRVRKKLHAEGLFDPKFKKPIPEFAYRVGIVTASNGAAIEDIKKIITNKNNFTDIVIFPTVVQGALAPASIIENIEAANLYSETIAKIDTLIVGRGGGSPEDLMAFNDEEVARAIFASKIPIISAVGHQSDFLISDEVADLRAETPTAAANIAVMDTYELHDQIEDNLSRLNESMLLKIRNQREVLENKVSLLSSNINNKVQAAKHMIEVALVSIKENDPRNIFAKGYSAVLDDESNIVSSLEGIEEGQTYTVRMRDGNFKANVISKEERK